MVAALLAVVVAALVTAPTAAGASVALRDDPAASAVALGGPEVLVLREVRDERVELVAVMRTGGPGRTLLSVDRARLGWLEDRALAASDARAALIVERLDRRGRTTEWRVYSGPPSGPLQVVRRTPDRGSRTWIPLIVDVDGGRVLLGEFRQRDQRVRADILDPAGGRVPVAWARPAFAPVAIAGEHVAVGALKPRRAALADLATGTEQASLEYRQLTDKEVVDLAGGGRLVAADAKGLATVRPGEPATVLPDSEGLTLPRFAGDAIAAVDDGRPVLVRSDGSREVLGPPTRVMTDFTADERGVAWIANGCVRHAAIGDTGLPPPPASDPCPSTEVGLYLIADSRLRGRAVRVPVRCVTAPAGVCRGTVRAKRGGRLVGRGRFAIPVGRERWVRVRLTRRAAVSIRRAGWGSLVIGARVPDGRVGTGRGDSELSVKVPRRRRSP